ncbi:hypothetical protein ACOSQ4_006770 [Xanthoceras sorbifolium]
MKAQKQEERGLSGKESAGDASKSKMGTGDTTVTGVVAVSTKINLVEKKEEDSRIGPGLGVYGVGLEGEGERGLIESKSSVGLVVEAQGGCLTGEGGSLVDPSVTLGSIVGDQNIVIDSVSVDEIEPGFIDRVAMEACVDVEVNQIEAHMVKSSDPKEKNVKKWKGAARA